MKYYRAISLFLRLLGGANWYSGIDKPTMWQWLYQWRLGPKTAWNVAKDIWL